MDRLTYVGPYLPRLVRFLYALVEIARISLSDVIIVERKFIF